MSMTLTNQNNLFAARGTLNKAYPLRNNKLPAAYGENSKNSAGRVEGEETAGFVMPFLGTKSNPPSFVGKAYTREELLQAVNDEVKQNQSKKMSLADMIKKSCFEGTKAKFRFAGDSKIYTFDEYIQELEKQFKQNSIQ